MDAACKKKKIKHKISVAVESGFKCGKCEWETITFDGTVPKACLHCGEKNPKQVWKDIITNKTVVETVKL